MRKKKAKLRNRNRHWEDRQTRNLRMLTELGFEPTAIRGSRQASRLARYTNAVGHFYRTGDVERLREFSGQKINGRALITDPEVLTELAQAGELELQELYVHPRQSQ